MIQDTLWLGFVAQLNTRQTGCCKTTPRPFSSQILMAQFNIDVDSGNIRISQLIYGICPGMSQATLFPRVFVVYALVREGLVHLKRVRNTPLTFDTCNNTHNACGGYTPEYDRFLKM